MVAVAQVGEHYYLYSSTLDPTSYPACTPTPHLIKQPGCVNSRHLIKLGLCGKNETYGAVKVQSDHAVERGGHPSLKKMWMIGSGSTDSRCLSEAGCFIKNVGDGTAGISPRSLRAQRHPLHLGGDDLVTGHT